MSERTLQLNDDLSNYILSYGIREPDVVRECREYTRNLPDGQMYIAPEQGQFLSFLLKLMNAQRVLEIGMFTGYSALWMALALGEYAELVTLDISDKYLEEAKGFWEKAGVLGCISPVIAPAMESMQLFIDKKIEPFDLIFIDADKENIVEYYKLAKLLIRKGGVIAIDNVLKGGLVLDKRSKNKSVKAVQALNKLIHKDKGVQASLLPIGDGLTLVR